MASSNKMSETDFLERVRQTKAGRVRASDLTLLGGSLRGEPKSYDKDPAAAFESYSTKARAAKQMAELNVAERSPNSGTQFLLAGKWSMAAFITAARHPESVPKADLIGVLASGADCFQIASGEFVMNEDTENAATCKEYHALAYRGVVTCQGKNKTEIYRAVADILMEKFAVFLKLDDQK